MARKIETTDDKQEAADLFGEIELQELEVQKLTLALNTAKLDLKDAREAYDAGVSKIRALARTRLNSGPLFDQQDEEATDHAND